MSAPTALYVTWTGTKSQSEADELEVYELGFSRYESTVFDTGNGSSDIGSVTGNACPE
ncbi:hypothetical protein DPMN_101983 [Dreissena polymorpha]|uniref:Uncharacterized protein n=1 Tax=Dreissena polymorpha TaxID=45954 RepID=A0A9D4LJV6_DREPO|nr:hypothetical protein DPMN_101983 [Dreissena polymorpha]